MPDWIYLNSKAYLFNLWLIWVLVKLCLSAETFEFTVFYILTAALNIFIVTLCLIKLSCCLVIGSLAI